MCVFKKSRFICHILKGFSVILKMHHFWGQVTNFHANCTFNKSVLSSFFYPVAFYKSVISTSIHQVTFNISVLSSFFHRVAFYKSLLSTSIHQVTLEKSVLSSFFHRVAFYKSLLSTSIYQVTSINLCSQPPSKELLSINLCSQPLSIELISMQYITAYCRAPLKHTLFSFGWYCPIG
jgi:hypothetical protein